MYKNRRYSKNTKAPNKENVKLPLNTIDEDRTIKITQNKEASSSSSGTVIPNKRAKSDNDGVELDGMFSSEENVPASQEPTQRYLSQRSTIAASLTRTQSRNLTQRPPNTYFELVLIKSGVQLDGGENFILSCDHVTFVSKFREIFIKCQNYPDNVETFKTGLNDALSPKSRLAQKLLSGCTICIPGEDNVYQSQDSMIVNFLMIDFLCDHVLDVLLNKIENIACDCTIRLTSDNIPLLPLLLAQLRYVSLTHGGRIYESIKVTFEKASEIAKMDIIANAEFIIDPSRHDAFVQMLLDNVAECKDLFQSTTVTTLTNLSLSTKIQEKLRYRILEYIKDNECPNKIIPLLVKFLLKHLNEDNDDSLYELIKTIQEILIWRSNDSVGVMDKPTQLELFNFIEQSLTRSKKFYSIWQKISASLSGTQFKAVDFIILLLLVHVKEDNCLHIENILRRRIKLDHIAVEILVEAKSKYAYILELRTNSLMQILHDFLREKNKEITNFARAAYGTLFQICASLQKGILKKLIALINDKSSQNMTNMALELLLELQRKYPKDVQNWGSLLMPLLDRLNDMSLSQTRLVMELLCSIAYPPPTLSECSILQNQIDMMVKKQLINHTTFIKKQGIIGAVQLIDSIARIEEAPLEADDSNVTINTVNDLPDGRGKIAGNYIVRVQSSTMYCAESLGLFYDELATVCAAPPTDEHLANYLDKSFLIWLCELMTYYFQNSFVAEHTPERILGIDLAYQKCINTIEDTNTEDPESEVPQIAINIAELTLRPAAEASSSILVLAPLFNLVRVLHLQRNEGSLEQINALLGCAIILPTFFDDPHAETIIYEFDERLQSKILDIYFHCVNWMRETVSSFATQHEEMIRRKVLRRLNEVIVIEERIRKLLLKASPNYWPPLSQFINIDHGRMTTQSKSYGAKIKPRMHHNDSEQLTLNDTINIRAVGKGKGTSYKLNFEHLYGPKEIYRQVDPAIMLLLQEKLSIQFPFPQEEIGKQIGLLEFRFILTDLVWKLESITGVQKFHSEQTLQYIAKPHYFISDISKFLTAILANMEMISKAINEQLDKSNRLYSHTNLFTDEVGYLKSCFGLCIHLFAAYFSWSEFMDATRVELLKASLLALLDKSQQMQHKTLDKIIANVFNRFLQYESSVIELKTAVHLHQLLNALQCLMNSRDANATLEKQANEIRTLCKTFLLRKWFNYDGTLETGATCNLYLNMLVKGFLKKSDLRRQCDILRVVVKECKQLGNKDSALKSFPNIKKANFPLLFRGLCEMLTSSLSEHIVTSAAGTSSDGGDKLKIWEKSCELLNLLLEIVQSLDIPRNFQFFLKHSHIYLKLALQHGLPVYEKYLRQNPERVSDLLKDMQITTRFLHNLCCHSKALKNTVIVSQIPFVRETVENLVFRVKALLAANKCASVFWMGNLKNKDLHGDEILSQSASLTKAADQEGSDEEIPDDDVSLDETILGQNEVPGTISGGSTTFNNNRSKSSSRSKCY